MHNSWKIESQLPEFASDIADELRLFLGDIVLTDDNPEYLLEHGCAQSEGCWEDVVVLRSRDAGKTRDIVWRTPVVTGTALEVKKHRKRAVKLAVYHLISGYTGLRPPWGSLTGIRPTRLLYQALEEGRDIESAAADLVRIFDVRPDRVQLLLDIIRTQQALPASSDADVDVYIGIPFCTTVCHYCSFATQPLPDAETVDRYVGALLSEMEQTVQRMPSWARWRSLYIGGGTPTSLDVPQLGRLLEGIARIFPGKAFLEYTVEAGRPDTLDREKIDLLGAAGVNRLSINPQTFQDRTLSRIGRAHDAAAVERIYSVTREAFRGMINMDIIAALPGEDKKDFEDTLRRLLALSPDNATVHTLSVKKRSQMRLEQGMRHQPEMQLAQAMVDSARERLGAAGYAPYYLYRQKYASSNLENVGYALPGAACIYNVDQMEETTSILAFGAGSISKRVRRDGHVIRRAANVRDLAHYMARWDEMARRKMELFQE